MIFNTFNVKDKIKLYKKVRVSYGSRNNIDEGSKDLLEWVKIMYYWATGGYACEYIGWYKKSIMEMRLLLF